MEHSAMIMRVKFMTRSGEQWGLRLIVFVRVRDLFEEHRIKFAIRQITVRLASRHLCSSISLSIQCGGWRARNCGAGGIN